MISSRSLLRLAFQANERSLLKASKMTLSLPNNDVLETLSSPSGEILTSEKGSKRIVTLNRPKALNALNLTMIRELYPLLKKWDLGGDTTLVIVKGAGDKAFCAGGDVLAAIKSAKEGGTVHKDFFREEYYLNHLIGTLRIPYVAFIDGIVMGGGCGLSVNGRFRVATEKTLLAMPETALGLFPDVGGSYFLPRLKGRLGIYLALTGYRLKAADAVHVGLATHYVPSASLPALEDALVALPDDKVNEQTVDATIRSLESKNPPPFSLLPHVDEIARTFDARSVEGIISKLEQEKTEWSRNTLKTLETLSPTSLKVTFRQMQLGARTSFAKVFTMEYRLTQRFLEDHDFFEGCRAILIEKDRNPRWKPAKLSDVTDEHVEAYFAPLKHPQELVLHED